MSARICLTILLWIVTAVTREALAKTLDLATRSEPSGTYEIGFCARESPDTLLRLPGHAFVSFSHLEPAGRRTFLAVGHTVAPGVSPAEAAWSYIGDPVNGYVKEELYTNRMQVCLIARLDKSDYDVAFSKTQSPLEQMGVISDRAPVLQAYKLGAEDCISFMIGVAKGLEKRGLKVPKRNSAELPLKYIRRFIESN